MIFGMGSIFIFYLLVYMIKWPPISLHSSIFFLVQSISVSTIEDQEHGFVPSQSTTSLVSQASLASKTSQSPQLPLSRGLQSSKTRSISHNISSNLEKEYRREGPPREGPPCIPTLTNHKTAPGKCYNIDGKLNLSTPMRLLDEMREYTVRIKTEVETRTIESSEWKIFRYNQKLLQDLIKVLENSVNIVPVDDHMEEMYDYIMYGFNQYRVQDMFLNQHSPELWIPFHLQHHPYTSKLLYKLSPNTNNDNNNNNSNGEVDPPLFHYINAHIYSFCIYVLQENKFFNNPIFYYEKYIYQLTNQNIWKYSYGLDFIIPASHPYTPLSINDKTIELNILAHASFLVVDNDIKSRYPKDTIIPYFAGYYSKWIEYLPTMTTTPRNNLIFFAGSTTQSIRVQLVQAYRSITEENSDIIIQSKYENITEYYENLYHSIFCLIVRGDTTSSSRLFVSIMMGCIPIIISDWILLPYEKMIDYSQFTIQMEESFILSHPRAFVSFIREISLDKIKQMQVALVQARQVLLYQSPQQYNPVTLLFIDNLVNRIHLCINILGNSNIPIFKYGGKKTSLCNRIQSRIKKVLHTDIFEIYGRLIQSSCNRNSDTSTPYCYVKQTYT